MGVQPEQLQIGERVKAARTSVNLTQRELGEALPRTVVAQHVSDIENGRARLTERQAADIEWITNATPGYIFTGEGYLPGGQPRLTPPTGVELELTQRVADLERELSALRSAIAVVLEQLELGTLEDIEVAERKAHKLVEKAGQAARAEEKRQA